MLKSIVTSAILTVAALASVTAHADGSKWVSIAVNPTTLYYGYAVGATDQATSDQNAISHCGDPSCQVKVSQQDGCASLAMTADYKSGGFGSYQGTNSLIAYGPAEQKALNACVQESNGGTCHTEFTMCSWF